MVNVNKVMWDEQSKKVEYFISYNSCNLIPTSSQTTFFKKSYPFFRLSQNKNETVVLPINPQSTLETNYFVTDKILMFYLLWKFRITCQRFAGNRRSIFATSRIPQHPVYTRSLYSGKLANTFLIMSRKRASFCDS